MLWKGCLLFLPRPCFIRLLISTIADVNGLLSEQVNVNTFDCDSLLIFITLTTPPRVWLLLLITLHHRGQVSKWLSKPKLSNKSIYLSRSALSAQTVTQLQWRETPEQAFPSSYFNLNQFLNRATKIVNTVTSLVVDRRGRGRLDSMPTPLAGLRGCFKLPACVCKPASYSCVYVSERSAVQQPQHHSMFTASKCKEIKFSCF